MIWNIGNYHLSFYDSFVSLHQISNDSGGVSEICSSCTRKELYKFIQGMLLGLDSKKMNDLLISEKENILKDFEEKWLIQLCFSLKNEIHIFVKSDTDEKIQYWINRLNSIYEKLNIICPMIRSFKEKFYDHEIELDESLLMIR